MGWNVRKLFNLRHRRSHAHCIAATPRQDDVGQNSQCSRIQPSTASNARSGGATAASTSACVSHSPYLSADGLRFRSARRRDVAPRAALVREDHAKASAGGARPNEAHPAGSRGADTGKPAAVPVTSSKRSAYHLES